MTTITIRRPDDMHVHVRSGDRVRVVAHTARQFGRAIIMPNISPYVATVEDAQRYRDEILSALPSDSRFKPLMTLYLQTTTSPDTIRAAKRSGIVHGLKLYPAGVTTNSDGGLARVQDVKELFKTMEEVDMPLLIHGETADKKHDEFDRESLFYKEMFPWIISSFPRLRVVCEHITTQTAAEMVERAPEHLRLGATITPHHLLENRNYLLGNGLRPHAYCKPIPKREEDRMALLVAATSGNPRFFLGTDSAPHPRNGEPKKAKECDCGCAGCFTAHAAIELYAEAFDSVGKLDQLEDFGSRFGAEFYELPLNQDRIILKKESWQAESSYVFGDTVVVPFRQEVPLLWRMGTLLYQ